MSRGQARWQLLESAAKMERPVVELKAWLNSTPVDPNKTGYAVITRSRMIDVLGRYLAGGVDEEELEEWANLIEGNDEFRYEKAAQGALEDLVYQIANPLLCGAISVERAAAWREMLLDDTRFPDTIPGR